MTDLLADGRADGRGLSTQDVLEVHVILHKAVEPRSISTALYRTRLCASVLP